jgi:hypothetical protein
VFDQILFRLSSSTLRASAPPRETTLVLDVLSEWFGDGVSRSMPEGQDLDALAVLIHIIENQVRMEPDATDPMPAFHRTTCPRVPRQSLGGIDQLVTKTGSDFRPGFLGVILDDLLQLLDEPLA